MKDKFLIVLIASVLCVLLGGCGASKRPAAGLPKDPSQMTNKQKQQFNEWQAEQDKLEWENSVAR